VTCVVVLGASGEMGARVVRLLQAQLPDVRVVEASRRGGRAGHPMRAVDVHDLQSLQVLLAEADLVVNAVGPFSYDPAALLTAAIDARCHYADLAEAPEFVERVRSVAAHCGAVEAGVAVISGCSTLPGLVQLLAGRWSGRDDVAQVGAWLSLGSRNPVSRGLLLGMLQPPGRIAPGGQRWFREGGEATTQDGRRLRFGSYPAPFGDGVALGERRVPLHFHMGFDRACLTGLLALAAPLLGRLPRQALPPVATALRVAARAARPLGSRRGVLILVAEDEQGAERARVELHADTNGLDVPAAPPVWVARCIAQGAPPAGLVSLDAVVPRHTAELWLRESGFRIVESGEN